VPGDDLPLGERLAQKNIPAAIGSSAAKPDKK
jgi:hypothetical protein